jgi:histone deacetylase complex regulatory component SIN3
MITVGLPKNLMIKYRAENPNGKRIHDETPKDAGNVPITIATMPVVKAYGNCVLTCSM